LDDGEKQYFQEVAGKLQDKTLENLWMPHESFFAIGLDRDESGETRQIATLTSNAIAVLDSQLLLDLDEERRLYYVEPIVYAVMSPQFLTEAGIRTRALRHSGLIDIADYHGSKVSWPKETSDIARGLRRHGYEEQAKELEDRLLRLVARSGECYEFYYVDEDGQVKYHYRNENPEEPQFHDLGAANLPEPCHVWTLSAVIRLALQETTPPVDKNV
ncbi:MAG: MGH1-like glycoside hydrolase domain-containing protein, partial [Microcoleus sp.]